MKKNAISDIIKSKHHRRLSMLTCYDYSFARLLDGRVDMILVGDSLGNVVLGYDRTTHVTMDDMVRHIGAVRRGAPNTLIIGDMPAGSYEESEAAIANAQRLINAGADAVKPEGQPEIVRVLTNAGFAVMGHLGYLPQTAIAFKIVGRENDEALELQKQAKEIESAGAFCVVLECVPATAAKKLTAELTIPTIGIGAGAGCDGQVLVLYDLLGLFSDFKPKFVRQYANLAQQVRNAVDAYVHDICENNFPGNEEEYH
jgi:3-methyl-2-oxobutanoate hydroxymethyltransferase